MQMWGGDDPNNTAGSTLSLPGYDTNSLNLQSQKTVSPITLPDLTNVDVCAASMRLYTLKFPEI